MPALDVARALGRPDAIAASTDVHMSHFVLVAPADGGTEPLRAGGWRILPSLEGHPRGDDVPGLDRPAFRLCLLTGQDRVGAIRIERA